MKILWYSTAPFVGVGYGVLTNALVPRIVKDGHFVKIATKHHLGGSLIVSGVEVFDGTECGMLNKLQEVENYDYIVSVFDTWTMAPPGFNNWVAVNFLDIEIIHHQMIKALRCSQVQTAVTQHGMREMERVGFKPYYTPLGVDTKLFRPDKKLRKEFREKWGWSDDTFVIGVVGINYSNDRKNIIGTLRAFQGFHKEHPNSALYLHSDTMGSATQGLPLQWIIASCGFDGTGKPPVYYVDQLAYHSWNISQKELVGLYNAFDVMCLPSQGEGFGMPWIEAEACGCPVISADTTSGKELNFGGWVIPVVEDYYEFSSLLSWYARVPPSAIFDPLEEAYKEWKSGAIKKRQKLARKGALEYDWDVVYTKYWRPLLQDLEKRSVTADPFPNYALKFYGSFGGRILMVDCQLVCQHPEICDLKYPLLPGELGLKDTRSMLARSYPIVADKKGKLCVCTRCPLHKWLSPRFVEECKDTWTELWAFPRIREAVGQLWDKKCFDAWGTFVELDRIEHDFDESYAQALQSRYYTTFQLTDEVLSFFPKGCKVLDVGAGDGRRVKELRAKGFDAVGTEVNKSRVDGDLIVYGDIMALPFKENSFDVVMAIDVLEHLEEPLKAIAELLYVSRDKVVLQITPSEDATYREDSSHVTAWSTNHWKRELFEFAEIKKALPGCGFILEKKKRRSRHEDRSSLPQVPGGART